MRRMISLGVCRLWRLRRNSPLKVDEMMFKGSPCKLLKDIVAVPYTAFAALVLAVSAIILSHPIPFPHLILSRAFC